MIRTGTLAALLVAAGIFQLTGCAGPASRVETRSDADEPITKSEPTRRTSRGKAGGYYLDDGPGDNPPPNLLETADAVPRTEPVNPRTSEPYTVMGRSYRPIEPERSYKERGVASWYGRRFHGKKTSSGEPYDMYAMTAAHPTLPVPGYARVTHLENGRSVIVRINDRGPFHDNRIIDLSYTAAYKLGVVGGGSAAVEVEYFTPAMIAASDRERGEAQAKAEGAKAAETIRAAAPPRPTGSVYLQAGAFGGEENALRLAGRLRQVGAADIQVIPHGGLHRVLSGPHASREDATQARTAFAAVAGITPHVVDLGGMFTKPVEPAGAGTAVPTEAMVRPVAQMDTVPLSSAPVHGAPGHFIQVGAFGAENNAARLAETLRRAGAASAVVTRDGFYRVWIGPYADRDAAVVQANVIAQATGVSPRIISR